MDALFKFLESNPLALLAFGAVLAVIVGVRYLGLWQGQNAGPAKSQANGQVVAMVVDPTAITAAAGEVTGLAIAVTAQTAAMDRQTAKLDQLVDGIERLRDQLVYVAAKIDRSG